MIKNYLSKEDTNSIKGIAILCIVLHNTLHYLQPHIGENEFDFGINHWIGFVTNSISSPSEFVNLFFSLFGHYGVQAFILISGYGLTKSMLIKRRDWLTFVVNRICKLLPLVLIGLALAIAFFFLSENRCPNNNEWLMMFHKLTFLHTLIPNESLTISGPWWFLGLIFQLYLLFPLLFNLVQRYNTKALTVISTISITLIFLINYEITNPACSCLMKNAPAHLSEFTLGIWLANNQDKKMPNWIGITALTTLILGNVYKFIYPFTYLSASVLTIWLIPIFKRCSKSHIISFIGSISMLMFISNGFVRDFILNNIEHETTLGKYLITGIILMSAIAISAILKPLYNTLVNILNKQLSIVNGKTPIRQHAKSISTIIKIATICVFTYFIAFYSTCSKHLIQEDSLYSIRHIITEDSTYTSLIHYQKLNSNYLEINIDIEFDIEYKDEIDPLVITNLIHNQNDHYWDKTNVIPNTTEGHCHISKQILVNGFSKNDILKVYIWNNKSDSFEIKDSNVKITGIRSFNYKTT